MKTVILMPSEAECEIVARDQQGREVKLGSIEIVPTFWNPKATPGLLFFETRLDDYIEEGEDGTQTEQEGKLLQRGAITLSGTTGKLAVSDRTRAVLSHYESQLETVVEEEQVESEPDVESDSEDGADEEPIARRKKKGVR